MDIELFRKYIYQTLQVCKSIQQREMTETGIPERFLIKYLAFERNSTDILFRGIDAIIISPIFEDDILIGMLVLDYVNIELYGRHKDDKDLDKKMKQYSEKLKPYISYPKDYKFE